MKAVSAVLSVAWLVGLVGVATAQESKPAGAGKAFPKAVAAGQTVTMDDDLFLSGSDSIDINGTADKPCIVIGNGHQIKTKGEWTGRFKANCCTFKDLGKTQKVIKTEKPNDHSSFKVTDPDVPAMVLTAGGKGDINFDHCTFDASSFLTFTANGESTFSFRNSTMLENGIYPVSEMPETSRHAFTLSGSSQAKKFFQGNRVYKGECHFQSANVLIGGDKDEDSNLVIGIRAKIQAAGQGTIIRGNYVHVLLLDKNVPPNFEYWSQVWTFSPGEGTIAEHNVIRDGEWIIRFVKGEFRYNLICDINDHDLCQNGSIGRIHHNIFFGSKPDHFQGQMGGCIAVVYKPETPDGGIEVFNNVFDGCGWLPVPVMNVGKEGFIKSYRNNVAFNFALGDKYVRVPASFLCRDWTEDNVSEPPARLGYADYNLWYNPKSKSKTVYGLSVAGKTLRKDAGFGLNDVPKGGAVDEQADPKFAGPLPTAFNYKDEDIKSGKVTVSQILADFRKAYTPAAGSPLIDAGDKADGEGTDIGAVGAGKAHKDDLFGTFGKATSQPGK